MTTKATWPDGINVVFRSLNWGEYREIQSHLGPPAEKASLVYKLCCIDGPSLERVPAGIMMWLYQNELTKSPFAGSFQALVSPLNQFRSKINGTYLLCAQAMIASVFKITFADMDKWDSDTFLTRLAQAEFISGVPLNPLDPNAPVEPTGTNGKPLKKQKLLSAKQTIAYERKKDHDRDNAKRGRSAR